MWPMRATQRSSAQQDTAYAGTDILVQGHVAKGKIQLPQGKRMARISGVRVQPAGKVPSIVGPGAKRNLHVMYMK